MAKTKLHVCYKGAVWVVSDMMREMPGRGKTTRYHLRKPNPKGWGKSVYVWASPEDTTPTKKTKVGEKC